MVGQASCIAYHPIHWEQKYDYRVELPGFLMITAIGFPEIPRATNCHLVVLPGSDVVTLAMSHVPNILASQTSCWLPSVVRQPSLKVQYEALQQCISLII